jgi:hypothetical protein
LWREKRGARLAKDFGASTAELAFSAENLERVERAQFEVYRKVAMRNGERFASAEIDAGHVLRYRKLLRRKAGFLRYFFP